MNAKFELVTRMSEATIFDDYDCAMHVGESICIASGGKINHFTSRELSENDGWGKCRLMVHRDGAKADDEPLWVRASWEG